MSTSPPLAYRRSLGAVPDVHVGMLRLAQISPQRPQAMFRDARPVAPSFLTPSPPLIAGHLYARSEWRSRRSAYLRLGPRPIILRPSLDRFRRPLGIFFAIDHIERPFQPPPLSLRGAPRRRASSLDYELRLPSSPLEVPGDLTRFFSTCRHANSRVFLGRIRVPRNARRLYVRAVRLRSA